MRSLRVCVSFFTELKTYTRQFAVKEIKTGGRACPVQYALCVQYSNIFLFFFFFFFPLNLLVCLFFVNTFLLLSMLIYNVNDANITYKAGTCLLHNT